MLLTIFRAGAEAGQDEVFGVVDNSGKRYVKGQFNFTDEVIERLRRRAEHWAQLTEDETFLEIQEILADSVKDGLTVQQMIDRLADSAMLSDSRAERIARTEVIGALNEGKLDGYRSTGLIEKKEWLATMDDRTRGNDPRDPFSHLAADGEIVNLDEPFVRTGENLQFPGDPAGSPANIINCRCTVLPVIEWLEE